MLAASICISRGCCQCGQSVFVSVNHAISVGSRISRGCCQCGQSVLVSGVHAISVGRHQNVVGAASVGSQYVSVFHATSVRSQYLYQALLLPMLAVSICVSHPCHMCWYPSVYVSVVGAASRGCKYLSRSSMPLVLVAVSICISRGATSVGSQYLHLSSISPVLTASIFISRPCRPYQS